MFLKESYLGKMLGFIYLQHVPGSFYVLCYVFIAFFILARRLEAANSAPRRYSSMPTSNLNFGWLAVLSRLYLSFLANRLLAITL